MLAWPQVEIIGVVQPLPVDADADTLPTHVAGDSHDVVKEACWYGRRAAR
eukprot:COSAG05_NODE_2320_length_3240_cov_2.007641_7_plen_50_part_00